VLTPALAGKSFTASMRVRNRGLRVSGSVSCFGKLAGRLLRPLGSSAAGGKASCSWRLPPKAHGKRLAGSITETYRKSKVSRAFSAMVD
jgi:hypothetical protein